MVFMRNKEIDDDDQTQPQPPSKEQPPLQLAESPGGLGLVMGQQHMRPTSSMKPQADAKACAKLRALGTFLLLISP
ncbi:hypothetical protein RHSIM_Rhsim04G0162400 [Rhododendron simsii]|uniref:Uncharacterized protein n=1 Tax=Rhododendron simsii TaxID=118357 RepID=A0A834H221_RHOSS|nr:hypothetical protein RHSIM_Rhsim04G0162400 [Rhododendron simsii]